MKISSFTIYQNLNDLATSFNSFVNITHSILQGLLRKYNLNMQLMEFEQN